MNRTVEIEVGGRNWPMCLTLAAYIQICDRYGDLSACVVKLDNLVEAQDNRGLITEYAWLAGQLLQAAHNVNDFAVADDPPNSERILQLMAPGDIPYIQRKVLDAIRIGQSREVGVDASKNGEGATGG